MDNYDITSLDVSGFDAQVPNRHWTVGGDTLVVLLPGAGYTNHMPLMFYAHELAIQRKWDILEVNYDYNGLPKDTSREELLQRLTDDVRAAYDVAVTVGKYTKTMLVGKSLGTIAMATLLQSGIDQDVTTVWLTPLVRRPEIREAVNQTAGKAFVAIGTHDPQYDAAFLKHLQGAGATVEVIDGADHGMDIAGDMDASIGALRQIIASLDGFLVG